MAARTLIVIGDRVGDGGGTSRPRRDYDELRTALNADTLTADALDRPMGRTRGGIALARLAAARASDYQNIYCDSEHIALPLGFLLRRRQTRPRLTMIAHYLTPLKKRLAIRALRLHKYIDCAVLHSPAQMTRARSLGFSDRQLALVPYQVDTQFWQPQPAAPRAHIASCGQEFRDYMTLLRALDTPALDDLPVEIAAGSHWSSRKKNFVQSDIPARVHVERRGYAELREMYAGALFCVVPLHDVDFQAGIITILESMAMGKAVIVSRTRGQRGVVSGPLMQDGKLRSVGEENWPETTGLYVPPGDASAMRDAIVYLRQRPDVAERMGAAARRYVEAECSIERFVERMSAIIDPGGGPGAELAGTAR